ncbi:MAG: hypothetical protein NT118_15230 [Lentisphaerae bacterium]|nr:hypothetical protein [Lentisphaerota bacterium]
MNRKQTKAKEKSSSFDAASARQFKIKTMDGIPRKVLTAPVPVVYLDSSETLKYPQPSWSLGIWDMANSYTTAWYNVCRSSFKEFQELGFELFTGTIRVDDKFRKEIGNADFAIALVPVKEGKHQTGKLALKKYNKYLELMMRTPGAVAMGEEVS